MTLTLESYGVGMVGVGVKRGFSSVSFDGGNKLYSSKCFPSGTLVATSKGLKAIDELNEGELVLAYDFVFNKIVERKILKLEQSETDTWIEVNFSNGARIVSTRGHLFWVENIKTWVQAIDLKEGMRVLTQEGKTAEFTNSKIHYAKNKERTYNFEVEEFHNYFVGKDRILVHNGKPDFYVSPDGQVMPSTGYRYMDSKFAKETMLSMKAPGSYFGFEKFDTAAKARDAFQISYPDPYWSDAKLRGTFDTLQLGDKWYVPLENGGKGPKLEPITFSYPQYGKGGIQQLKTNEIIVFDAVELLK